MNRSNPKCEWHGYTRNGQRLREYWIWAAMLGRCYNPKNKDFKHYGQRGIKVCDRWHSFGNFYADMGPRPSRGHSLERKKNGGNYEPKNCSWAGKYEQVRNKRNNIHVTLHGRKMILKDAARSAGVDYLKLWRLTQIKGVRIDRAIGALQ